MTDNIFDNFRSQDQLLYDEWKQDPNKKTMGRLINQLSPIIYKEVRGVAGALPTEALGAEAKRWAIKAVKTYNPDKGAALSTHTTRYIQRVRRMNYQYQNSARLPEDMQLQYHKWSKAHADLEASLNRDPNDSEMAREMGWSESKVKKYRGMLYADHFESGSDRPTDVYEINNDKLRMDYVMGKLDKQEQFILKNSKAISATDMSNKLGVNINQLNYMKKKLRGKIEDLQKEIGYY